MELNSYDVDFIQSYLDAKELIPDRQRKRFEATLMKEHLDLLYLKFLSDYQGESDIFGVVIDRDSKSHPRKMIEEVFSDCDNKGYKSTLGKIVVKTRKVDLKYLEEFVNLDEAYNRIEKFVETDSFTYLTEDEKLNTILFLKTAKQQNKEDSFFGGVPEDALADWLEQTKH